MVHESAALIYLVIVQFLLASTMKDDLGRKSCIQIVIPREWNLCQGFKNRALSSRLVSVYDELWK